MNILSHLFSIAIQSVGVAALADFCAGVIHWLEDAYFTENTPVIGPLFIKPNIVHHHLPRHFTKLSWWESSKDLLLAGVFLIGLSAWLHLATWHVILFVVLGVNANQIHKWSHRTRTENGRVISALQDWRILQTPRHHGLHHKDPKNTYYCPITNFVNPLLERVSFWTRVEAIIERATGIVHRTDTAVLGQGPGPQWLALYRPASRLPILSLVKPSCTRACNHDCSRCLLRSAKPLDKIQARSMSPQKSAVG